MSIDESKVLPVSSQVASVLYLELFEETWKAEGNLSLGETMYERTQTRHQLCHNTGPNMIGILYCT